MSLKLHNFTWEQVRLVQVETLPHHIAGVLSNIRDTLASSDCEWQDIYSAYYESDQDGTTTFYEGESIEAGNPGIWTYVVYDCALGEEEVVINLDVDTLDPALKLRQIVVEAIAASSIGSPAEPIQKLSDVATEHGIFSEVLLPPRAVLQENQRRWDFDEAAAYVLEKNAELYRRLA
jgi:hypothetical protein